MHYRPSNIGNIPALYFEMPKTFSNSLLEKNGEKLMQKLFYNGIFRLRQNCLTNLFVKIIASIVVGLFPPEDRLVLLCKKSELGWLLNFAAKAI